MELDILYLQLEMKQKHNKLWSKINEQFAEASFVPFLEGFYDFFYIRDNFNIKKLFNQAIRQGCTHPLLYTSYGNLYHRENNIKLAKELYHTALKYDSQFSVAWFNLGVFAFAENQRNDAEINFLRSLHGKAHYFKGYFGIFQCIEKKLNSHHILMIPLLFAAYISECQQILNKFSFKVHELEYILHIPLEFQKELIKQFDLIWELYNKMSFEQFWNSRQTFYDDLIKFGAGLEKIVHNKAPSYP